MDDLAVRTAMSGGRRRLAGLLALALCIVACSGDDDADSTTTTRATTSSSSASTTTSSVATTSSTTTTSSPTTSTGPSTTAAPQECVDLLVLGCQGLNVARLQRLLRSKVAGGVAADEDFGQQTEGALRSFEEFRCPASACVVDGRIVIDGPEWRQLEGLPTTTSTTFELSP